MKTQPALPCSGMLLASLMVLPILSVQAKPADNEPQIITDREGHMVCHLCGPDRKDSFFISDYPQGYKNKTDQYSKLWDMTRYTILLNDAIPAYTANRTPNFYYIDKYAASPTVHFIEFDDDRSDLSAVAKVSVTENKDRLLLKVTWKNGEKNSFQLSNHALAYQAQILKNGQDQLICRNCGDTGKDSLIQGADEASLYIQLMDTPYYAFLAQSAGIACPAGSWYAVNKTKSTPEIKVVGTKDCSEIVKMNSTHDADKTTLNFTHNNRKKTTLTFSHR
ncbi:hypothetical protein H4F45_17245 [Pectobacterium brasiliense]|uniref:Secreted protein n=1 Tax=Pectobacterium brasiliense TaxID=180957 RepID=A0AAE2WH78_9GAMM|nr:hypothetical protein [Pectobacterium brasiliense]MBN3053193.1 hypothetical protein [Pectobacterium brasiliense]